MDALQARVGAGGRKTLGLVARLRGSAAAEALAAAVASGAVSAGFGLRFGRPAAAAAAEEVGDAAAAAFR